MTNYKTRAIFYLHEFYKTVIILMNLLMDLRFNLTRNKYQNPSPSFSGLNRTLSKHFIVDAKNLAPQLIDAYPKSRGFVGNLPADWIKLLPPNKIKQSVISIQNMFAELAKQLHTPRNFAVYNLNLSDFENSLNKILGLKVKVKDLDSGDIGKAFLMNVGDKGYIFKCFHSNIASVYTDVHGSIVETTRAPFVNRNSMGTFTKLFFGRIGTDSEKCGFMLTNFEHSGQKFSPEEKAKRLLKIIKSPVSTADMGLIEGKNDHRNYIGLKIIDYGYIQHIPDEIHSVLVNFANHCQEIFFHSPKKNQQKVNITNVNSQLLIKYDSSALEATGKKTINVLFEKAEVYIKRQQNSDKMPRKAIARKNIFNYRVAIEMLINIADKKLSNI